MFASLSNHTALLVTLAAISMLLLLISVLATPRLVAQLPADYLLQRPQTVQKRSVLRLALRAVRNAIGFVLIVLGLIMLLIPGPGLVTLLIGISMASFPGKQRLLRHLATRESVFNSLNWMRRRHNKVPLLHPSHKDP